MNEERPAALPGNGICLKCHGECSTALLYCGPCYRELWAENYNGFDEGQRIEPPASERDGFDFDGQREIAERRREGFRLIRGKLV